MPIVLDQSTNPDRFTARHWMFMPIERVTEPGLHAEESFDPNAFGNPPFLAYTVIDVLFEHKDLVTSAPDTGLFPGGTFVRQIVSTYPKTTRLRMHVGVTGVELELPNEFYRIAHPLTENVSGPNFLHDVEANPLVPGARYVAVTLLITERREWQTILEGFKTKRRKVTIQWKKFIVENDGDEHPWGDGDEVEIYFRTYFGSDVVDQQKWGTGNISDVPGEMRSS